MWGALGTGEAVEGGTESVAVTGITERDNSSDRGGIGEGVGDGRGLASARDFCAGDSVSHSGAGPSAVASDTFGEAHDGRDRTVIKRPGRLRQSNWALLV